MLSNTGGSNPETNNTAEHGSSLIVSNNKKAAAVSMASIAPASPRLQKNTDTSVKNYKLFCRLVLGIILALIGILCSVFIKPELYFSNYGKSHFFSSLNWNLKMFKRWYKYIEILILIFRVFINSFLINFWCADLDFGLKNSLDTAKKIQN